MSDTWWNFFFLWYKVTSYFRCWNCAANDSRRLHCVPQNDDDERLSLNWGQVSRKTVEFNRSTHKTELKFLCAIFLLASFNLIVRYAARFALGCDERVNGFGFCRVFKHRLYTISLLLTLAKTSKLVLRSCVSWNVFSPAGCCVSKRRENLLLRASLE